MPYAWWCGASQCGAKSNIFNPSLGLKNLFITLIFRYIPYIPLARTIILKAGTKKECVSFCYIRRNTIKPRLQTLCNLSDQKGFPSPSPSRRPRPRPPVALALALALTLALPSPSPSRRPRPPVALALSSPSPSPLPSHCPRPRPRPS